MMEAFGHVGKVWESHFLTSPCLFPPNTSDLGVQKTEFFFRSKYLKPYMIQDRGPLNTSNLVTCQKKTKTKEIYHYG